MRKTLTAHGDDPPTDWTYRYQYPSDCVKARFIENPLGRTKDPVPFDVEQSTDGTMSIVTNQNEACLIYTKDVTSPSLYSGGS